MLLTFAILPRSGSLPPSPPCDKATTRQDQAGKASARDGARDSSLSFKKGKPSVLESRMEHGLLRTNLSICPGTFFWTARFIFWTHSLTLLWQILNGLGFPNQFFCDSWVVGFWRADQ